MSEPYLPDPYFRRTVVLLCEHNEEPFGFVLNRHMDMGVNDLMENMPPIGARVSIGGPVQSGNLYYLHTLGAHVEGSLEVVDGVHMGGDYEHLRAILATDPGLAKQAVLRGLFRLGPRPVAEGTRREIVVGIACRQAPDHDDEG